MQSENSANGAVLVWRLFRILSVAVTLLLFCGVYADSITSTSGQSDTDYLQLDNGILTVRMNLWEFGGAITYLSLFGHDRNIVNTYDRGREIQQSYYAGRVPNHQYVDIGINLLFKLPEKSCMENYGFFNRP